MSRCRLICAQSEACTSRTCSRVGQMHPPKGVPPPRGSTVKVGETKTACLPLGLEVCLVGAISKKHAEPRGNGRQVRNIEQPIPPCKPLCEPSAKGPRADRLMHPFT